MKTAKSLLFLFLVTNHSFAQCYSKIVSYSRNYIALQTDGTLWSKGTTFNRGLLGFGDNPPPTEFTQIGTDSNWTDNISINSVNVFVIKTDGTLWVWGQNYPQGAAGLGTYDDLGYFGPTQVGTNNDWAKVSAGGSFTLAVKTDGTLWAWGSNAMGQLGIGNLDDSYKTNVPIQVGTETNWAKVFAETSLCAYAIKTNGTLWSWGNSGNYIGYADATFNNNYRSPHQIGNDTWGTIAVTGNTYTMTDGIKTDGSLWGWGVSSGVRYFFGNGIDNYASQIPIQIGTDSDWKQVCIGSSTTIALKNNSTRWGWGRNSSGYQLGMGPGMTSNVIVPTQLDSDTDWLNLNIDLIDSFGDGIKANNTLYHWGVTHTNIIYPSPTLFSATNCTLGLDNFLKNKVTIYPNPIRDFTNIHINENLGSQIEVSIINQLGQDLLVQKKEIVNYDFTLNLSNYDSGVYYLTLKSFGHTYKTKLIKY